MAKKLQTAQANYLKENFFPSIDIGNELKEKENSKLILFLSFKVKLVLINSANKYNN
jgi:hypothetical protein